MTQIIFQFKLTKSSVIAEFAEPGSAGTVECLDLDVVRGVWQEVSDQEQPGVLSHHCRLGVITSHRGRTVVNEESLDRDGWQRIVLEIKKSLDF